MVFDNFPHSAFAEFSLNMIQKMLDKNQMLYRAIPHELEKSIKTLTKLQYTADDAFEHPKLLTQTTSRLINRHQIFMEIGFARVAPEALSEFNATMLKTVEYHENCQNLPIGLDIVAHMYRCVNKHGEISHDIAYDKSDSLKRIHQRAIEHYLRQRLRIDKDRTTKWLFQNSRSLQSIEETIQIMDTRFEEELRALPKFLVRYLPNELKRLLDLNAVWNIDIRRILRRMDNSCNSITMKQLRTVEEICRRYGIQDYSMHCCPWLINMPFRRMDDYFQKISRLTNGKELLAHPFVTRLVYSMYRIQNYCSAKDMDFDSLFNDRFAE